MKKVKMTLRLWVGVIALASLTVVGQAIYLKGQPTEVAMPTVDLGEMPTRLGAWVGTDTPLDPDVFVHSEAAVAVSRTYRKAGANPIVLHAALWDRSDKTPHPPQECYSGAGFQLLSHKDLDLDLPNEATGQARYLVFERDHEDVCVLYWYHFGHTMVVDRDSLRSAQFAARDKEKWPAVLKVMLQTEGPNNEWTEERIREFAQLVAAWTDAMYGPEGQDSPTDGTPDSTAPDGDSSDDAKPEDAASDTPPDENAK